MEKQCICCVYLSGLRRKILSGSGMGLFGSISMSSPFFVYPKQRGLAICLNMRWVQGGWTNGGIC